MAWPEPLAGETKWSTGAKANFDPRGMRESAGENSPSRQFLGRDFAVQLRDTRDRDIGVQGLETRKI